MDKKHPSTRSINGGPTSAPHSLVAHEERCRIPLMNLTRCLPSVMPSVQEHTFFLIGCYAIHRYDRELRGEIYEPTCITKVLVAEVGVV